MDAGRFQDRCSASFPNMEVASGAPVLAGRIMTRRLDDCDVLCVERSPLVGRASRTRALAGGLDDRCKIVWQLAGASRYEGGHEAVRVSVGDAIVVPLGAAYTLEVLPGYRAIMLIVPIRQLRTRARIGEGPLLIEGNAAVNAAGSMVERLLDPWPDPSCGSLLVRAALDLVCGVARGAGDFQGSAVRRATPHIRARLCDRYAPADLARDMGMSRRSLYAALAAEGETPAKLIQRVRLDQAHREVLDPGQSHLSLTEIALRAGLNDGAALSRAFRATYGSTPSALRETRRRAG